MLPITILSLLIHQPSLVAGAETKQVVPPSDTVPSPRQPGWARYCKVWTVAEAGDTCWSIAQSLETPDVELFVDRNPQLQGDCRHNLWAGYWYCLGPVAGPATFIADPDGIPTHTTTFVKETRPPSSSV